MNWQDLINQAVISIIHFHMIDIQFINVNLRSNVRTLKSINFGQKSNFTDLKLIQFIPRPNSLVIHFLIFILTSQLKHHFQ